MMNKVLVIGGARSGCSVALLLNKKGYEVYITDQKKLKELGELVSKGIHVYDNGHPAIIYEQEYKFVVKNPGIPYYVDIVKFFVDKKINIYTEIEVASWYANKFRYGAITGTNGKTTITTLLYEMLAYNNKALVAGNIGTPLSELVLKYEDVEKDVALELSNFQLLGIESFKPMVSVVCNLAPDHLDYMGSEKAYYESKMKIYANMDQDDYFIKNVDDPLINEYAIKIPCRCITLSAIADNVDLCVKDHKVYLWDVCLFEVSDLKQPGKHMLINTMISACMAYLMGVSVDHIVKGIQGYKGVEHRLELVLEHHKVKYYNDSKATNTHACKTALSSFEENIILLAGGYDKGLSFDDLKQYNNRVKCCVSFGATKEAFKSVFENVHTCANLKEALAYAIDIACENDIVLLSPACSSYDQYDNYEQRGNEFKALVKQLEVI